MVSKEIPEEIAQAFINEQGFSLLIKGKAGTGKTTLALEILKNSDNPYFISTRASPSAIIAQHPEINEIFPSERIIDAAQIPEIVPITAQRELAVSYEKFTYHDLPEFFELLFQTVMESKKGTSPTVLIDTWDSLIEMNPPPTTIDRVNQVRLEAIFSEWFRQVNVNLILITENPHSQKLDSVVDGIVSLKDHRVNGLRVRTLEVQKMRKTRIRQPEYLYSLDGANFRYFDAYHFRLPEILLRPNPIPDLNITTISTGMQSFDDFLQGGYGQGSWNLFELSKGVGQGFLQILIPTLVNHLNQGRAIVAALPEGISPAGFERYLEGFVEGPKISQQLTLFDRPPVIENTISRRGELGETFTDSMEELRQVEDVQASIFAAPVIKILGLDKLEHIYSAEDLRKVLPGEVAATKGSTNIVISFVKEEQALVDTFSHLATMHYKLELINKTLVMRGIQPQTNYVAICPIISGGFLDTKLVPIV